MREALTRRLPDRAVASWAILGAAALVALVACALPAFELGLEASIGGGDAQRGFDYEREVAFLPDLLPWSLLAVGAALALLAASAAALRGGSLPWLVLLVCAVALLSLRGALHVQERIQGADVAPGVIGYEEPHGGPLLQPALDELKAEARRSPEAGEPGWELVGGEHGYRARARVGWWLLPWLAVTVSLVASYRTFRLFLRPVPAGAATAAATLVVLVWLFLEGLAGAA